MTTPEKAPLGMLQYMQAHPEALTAAIANATEVLAARDQLAALRAAIAAMADEYEGLMHHGYTTVMYSTVASDLRSLLTGETPS